MKTCKQLSYSEKLKRRNVWLWLLLGLMLVYMVLVGELGLGDSRVMSPLAESVSRIIFFGGMIWVGCKIARNKRILRDTQLLRACMEQELDERNRFLYEKSGGVVWDIVFAALLFVVLTTSLTNMPAFYTALSLLAVAVAAKVGAYLWYGKCS